MTVSRSPAIVGHTGLDEEAKQAFSSWLHAEGERPLRHRSTRQNIAHYLDGYGRCGGAAGCVADVQEAAGLPGGRGKGPLFGLIGGGGWLEDAARVLAAGAARRSPDALAIDLSEYRSGGCAYDVLSLHGVFAERSLPLDWRRVRIESEAAEGDVEGRCRELVLELLDRYASLVGAQGASPAAEPPVVAVRQSLAENSPLRPDLASRNFEYALGIGPEYHARVEMDPNCGQISDGTLPKVAFGEANGAIGHAGGMALGLRDVRRRSRGPFLDEHLVRIGEPEEERYFISRGRLNPAPRISSYPAALRSIEVAEIAARVPLGSLADPFGVAFFNHPSDEGWRRHMLLLSLYELFLLEEGA